MSYLVYLRSFLDVYRAGSISKAANRLGISQPAVSSHVNSLESLTGYVLFTRRSHGVIPTAEADDLACQIAHNLDTIEAKLALIRSHRNKLIGEVTIIGPAELLWAKSAKLLYPAINHDLRFKLLTGDRGKIYSSLNDGISQMAITTSQPDFNKFGHKIIGSQKLIVVTSATMSDYFKEHKLTAKLLEAIPLITYDDKLEMITNVFNKLFSVETDIQATIEVSDLRIVGEIINEINGWSVMPEYLCQADIAAGRLVKIETEKEMPENTIYLVWNESALRQPRVMFVKEHIIRIADAGVFN